MPQASPALPSVVEAARMPSGRLRKGAPADGAHRIHDAVIACRDNVAFMRDLPDGSMKLVVTSPPYNIGKSYEKQQPLEAYVESQKRVIGECVRLLHPNGSLCWQVGNHVHKGGNLPA